MIKYFVDKMENMNAPELRAEAKRLGLKEVKIEKAGID